MTRLLSTTMMPPRAAMEIEDNRALGEAAVRLLALRAATQPGVTGDGHDQVMAEITMRGKNLLDAWTSVVAESRKEAGSRSYSQYDRAKDAGKPLLYTPLEENLPPAGSDAAKFGAPTSMRDVEPSVHLWLERRHLGGKH